MNFNYIRHVSVVFFFIFFFSNVQADIVPDLSRKKKVLKKPYGSEYPSRSASVNNNVVDKPWIVFADKKDVSVYNDDKLTSRTGKIDFLDVFYVTDVTHNAFELIRYSSGLLKSVNIISELAKVEYIGWVARNDLATSDKAFVDVSTRMPVKYITMLNGPRIFDNVKKYTTEDHIKVFADPDMVKPLDSSKLSFNDVVYVYKQSADRYLLGKLPGLDVSKPEESIIGWVPSGFVQSWGVRLCIKPESTSPSSDSGTVLFRNDPTGYNLSSDTSLQVSFVRSGCDPRELLWNRIPVYENSKISKNKEEYNIIKTGTVIHPFDKRNSFIYNSKGEKVPYSSLCDITGKNRKLNIVFSINLDKDSKEFLPVILYTLQDLGNLFTERYTSDSIKFGFVTSSNNKSSTPARFYSRYSDILPALLNIVREGVESRVSNSSEGILNGLNAASELFSGHEHENNIIISISSKGDDGVSKPVYNSKAGKTMENLGKRNSRLLFFQPYCGKDGIYYALVEQARNFINGTAEINYKSRKEFYTATDNKRKSFNDFRSMNAGTTNVYCLDYPGNAVSQGFIVFPTVGDKAESRFLNLALDSLIAQIQMDNKELVASLSKSFNSPGLFNNSTSIVFERNYNGILPNDFAFILRNNNYNYFVNGFVQVPARRFHFLYEQSLLLSQEEYEEMYAIFKTLQIEALYLNSDKKSRIKMYNAMISALNKFSSIKGYRIYPNISFSRFFYETCGYTPKDEVLSKYTIDQLILSGTEALNSEVFRTMIEKIHLKFQSFYNLRENSDYTFFSNGRKFYHVTDKYLP